MSKLHKKTVLSSITQFDLQYSSRRWFMNNEKYDTLMTKCTKLSISVPVLYDIFMKCYEDSNEYRLYGDGYGCDVFWNFMGDNDVEYFELRHGRSYFIIEYNNDETLPYNVFTIIFHDDSPPQSYTHIHFFENNMKLISNQSATEYETCRYDESTIIKGLYLIPNWRQRSIFS